MAGASAPEVSILGDQYTSIQLREQALCSFKQRKSSLYQYCWSMEALESFRLPAPRIVRMWSYRPNQDDETLGAKSSFKQIYGYP